MARVLSGIQPTGQTHIGNYLGALRHWRPHPDHLYCIVDLHSMTLPYDPQELRESTRSMAALLMALGLHEGSVLFVQSQVPAHAELMWILSCVATMGELNRMTQFKSKGRGRASVSSGLFMYPVLMAADILLYQTEQVPVGDDQKQHVELTRDIAERFNSRFGPTFTLPEAVIPKVAARVMSLTNPTEKMSKSSPDPDSKILVADEPDVIRRKIMRAVTDSGREVRYDREGKPGISNLLEIMSAFTGRPIPELEAEYGDRGYGTFKRAVAEAVVEGLRPLQERLRDILADPVEIERTLARGAEEAAARAEPTLRQVKERVGLPVPARG